MAAEYKLNLKIPEAQLAIAEAVQAGLIACGITLERQVVNNITAMELVDTGRMRASITYKTKTFQSDNSKRSFRGKKKLGDSVADDKIKSIPLENELYVGTNVKYAPYLEYGTRRGIKPYSFMRIAMDQWRDKLEAVFGRASKKVMDSKK